MKSLTTLEISGYAHYTVLLHWLRSLHSLSSLLLKSNLWLHSLRCFNPLLLTWNIWLHSLHCFTFTTVKMKSLTTITTLFYFTTTNPKDRTTLTTMLLSLIHQIVFPQEFQFFHKFVFATVTSLPGSSVASYMLYYPLF